MTGAFVSHAAVGDYGAGAYHLTTTALIVLLAVASYLLRPGSRRLTAWPTSSAQRRDPLPEVAHFGLQATLDNWIDRSPPGLWRGGSRLVQRPEWQPETGQPETACPAEPLVRQSAGKSAHARR
jgi:hypothetical protein